MREANLACTCDRAVTLAILIVCSDLGRVNMLVRAERSLPADEVIVQVKDLVGRRRSFLTTPGSARAMLIATEPPLVLRAGLTALVSYYRVPADELDAAENHFENGVFSHEYAVKLRVACRGSALRRVLPA